MGAHFNNKEGKDKPASGKWLWMTLLVLFVLTALIQLQEFRDQSQKQDLPIIYGEVQLDAVQPEPGIPANVWLEYKAKKVMTDSMILRADGSTKPRQSLDQAADEIQVSYPYPGQYVVSMLANDSLLISDTLSVRTDGWSSTVQQGPHIMAPSYFEVVYNESMQFSESAQELLRNDPTVAGTFWYHADFGAEVLIDFDFQTQLSMQDAGDCARLAVTIQGDAGGITVPMVQKACERPFSLVLNNKVLDSRQHDLSGFVKDLNEEHLLTIIRASEILYVSIDDQIIFQQDCADIGVLLGFNFTFSGVSRVDFVSLEDKARRVSYRSNFNK